MLVASFALLLSTYVASSDTKDVPPPPTSHSAAYREAAKTISRTLNISRNPCDSFYEFACERYEGSAQVLDDAQEQVFHAVYKAINSSRGKPKPWKKYEQYVNACVASVRNHSSVLDPQLAVALMRNFTEETGLRFPLIDGRPVAEWPNGTMLGRALGYLGRIAGANPLFQTQVSSNVIDPEGAQPYYLFMGNVVPEPDFRKVRFNVHKVKLDGTDELLEKFANLVGRYIPKDVLATEVKAIERLGATINNVSGGMKRQDDFWKVFNPLTVVGVDSAFGDFINFTEFITAYTSSSSGDVQQRVRDPNYKISISAVEYFFKLKALLSEGNQYGVEAHTLYNLIYVQLLRYYERLFVEPKTVRRISAKDAVLAEIKRRRIGMPSHMDQARGEVVLPWSDTVEAAEYYCVANTAVGAMPFASGRAFIDAVFPTDRDRQEHLRTADRMVSGILDGLQSMIDQITWMSDESRHQAYEKLKKMVKNIGYPEFLVDDKRLAQYYSDFDLASANNSFVLAELSCYDSTCAGIWSSWPEETVNANYADTRNSINVPLAIIQKPLFDKDWPASLNFGGVGTIIGHEITHGFDTNGVQWDSIGRLSPWLDDKSQKAFDAMASCLIQEYDHFCPSENDTSECLSGNHTQTENIADNGGARAALRAYENEVGLNGPDPLLPGHVTNQFNHDQLFFLNFAHAWCAEKNSAVRIDPDDPHSPPKYRIHGTLQNFGAFAAAFNCPKGSEYAPKKHCNVWISEPAAANEKNF